MDGKKRDPSDRIWIFTSHAHQVYRQVVISSLHLISSHTQSSIFLPPEHLMHLLSHTPCIPFTTGDDEVY